MPWLGPVTIIGVIAVIVLIFVFLRTRTSDFTDEMLKKRAPESRIAERASYVEGNQRIPVALCLTQTAIFYENLDLQASLDLERIEEVEYDDELATGHEVHDGKVLRLRSHGQTFEFILDPKNSARWTSLLPSHRMDEPGNVGAQLI